MSYDLYKEEIDSLSKELEQQLLKLYGTVMLSGTNLQKALGYSSMDGLRQAILRKNIPIPIFSLEKRRGKYALVKDIALYLAKKRIHANHKDKSGGA